MNIINYTVKLHKSNYSLYKYIKRCTNSLISKLY